MEEAESPPVLTARALRALASTQAWAAFAGFALLCTALLAAIRSGVELLQLWGRYRAGGIPREAAIALTAGLVVALVWVLGANGALGWLAFRYGGALERLKIPARPDPADLTLALDRQHRYWRLQGVLLAVLLGLAAVALILLIVAAAIRGG